MFSRVFSVVRGGGKLAAPVRRRKVVDLTNGWKTTFAV